MGDRRLHLAVDGRELGGHRTGVGRFLRAILAEWNGPHFGHRLSAIAPFARPDDLADLTTLDWIETPGVAGTWWEQTTLPATIRKLEADVLFAPAYTAPLRRPCPYVLVVHDVSFFAHPEWFPAREGWRRRTLTRLAARRARSVVTVSEFSANEIVRWIGLPPARVLVARHGAPPEVPSADNRRPVVLFVGSLFNRRHIPELIEAFAEVARTRPAAQLSLVGDNRTSPLVDPMAIADRLGLSGRVEWRAYIDDGALRQAYAEARAFVFLSEYEGFALTPLEALSHGVPPVLLDTPVAREIYGPAAELVPLDRDAIAGAIGRVLDDDRRREDLLAAGRALRASLSWSTSAGLIQRTLEEAAASR